MRRRDDGGVGDDGGRFAGHLTDCAIGDRDKGNEEAQNRDGPPHVVILRDHTYSLI